MTRDIDDALLAEIEYFEQSATEYLIKANTAKLAKLTVAELRLLAVHYDLAGRADVKEWRKAELVTEIAIHTAQEDVSL